MKNGEIVTCLKNIFKKVYILFIVVDYILKHLSVKVFIKKNITKLSHFFIFVKTIILYSMPMAIML